MPSHRYVTNPRHLHPSTMPSLHPPRRDKRLKWDRRYLHLYLGIPPAHQTRRPGRVPRSRQPARLTSTTRHRTIADSLERTSDERRGRKRESDAGATHPTARSHPSRQEECLISSAVISVAHTAGTRPLPRQRRPPTPWPACLVIRLQPHQPLLDGMAVESMSTL